MAHKTPIIFRIDWNACIHCGLCVAVCPLTGFTTPFDTIAVDKLCAVVCMACEASCPVSAITAEEADDTIPVSL